MSEVEAELADAVVCLPLPDPMYFPDNKTGVCSLCGIGIFFRPHVSILPPKVCIHCATDMAKEEKAREAKAKESQGTESQAAVEGPLGLRGFMPPERFGNAPGCHLRRGRWPHPAGCVPVRGVCLPPLIPPSCCYWRRRCRAGGRVAAG